MSWQNSAVVTTVVEPEINTTERQWPNFDHQIGLTEAREMIRRYRKANPSAIHSLAITKVALERVLQQKDCAGGRFYFGMNPNGTLSLILVGVDELGNDLDEGELAERFYPCPPFCPTDSALNE